MKPILSAFLFLLLFSLLSPLMAQISVVPKPIVIAQIKGKHDAQIIMQVLPNDTLYMFQFRNNKYTSIVDVQSISFNKAELKELGDGLNKAIINSPGDQIILNKCAIIKEKSFGAMWYRIFRTEGGYSYLTGKQVDKMIEAIKIL